MKVLTSLFVCAALIATAASCRTKAPAEQAEPATTEPMAEKTPPYAMPGLSHGLLQSPVNILSDETKGGQHQIAVNYHHADPEYLDNKGTTIELDFPEGSSITFDGREYKLKQLHFHTPSEHQIDGVTYPMELHIVNVMDAQSEDDPPRYLVISYLFRMGEEGPFIASFLDQVPTEEGRRDLAPGTVIIEPEGRELNQEFYHYRGSLTTPPNTETVEWLIVKEIQQASPAQIRRINLLEGDNARHVQALYGRKVEN
jgi:carbonic anhydrase